VIVPQIKTDDIFKEYEYNLEEFLNYIYKSYSYLETSELKRMENEIYEYCESKDIKVNKSIKLLTEEICDRGGYCYDIPSMEKILFTFIERNGIKSKFSFSYRI